MIKFLQVGCALRKESLGPHTVTWLVGSAHSTVISKGDISKGDI